MSDKPDEGFVQRWSRLKQQARAEKPPEEAPRPDLPATAPGADATPPENEKKEEKPFDPASLPPVESLTKDSDYSLFMRPEVPAELRQKALRQLWATDPVLSAPDLFDMHNLDYNAVPTFPEGVRTLYRVGRGILDAAEAEAEAAADKAAAEKAAAKSAESEPGSVTTARDDTRQADAATQQEQTEKTPESRENNS